MKRKEIIIPAVASAAAAIVSGFITRAVVVRKYRKALSVMQKDIAELAEEYDYLNDRLDLMEDWASVKCDACDISEIFGEEEDNEDE